MSLRVTKRQSLQTTCHRFNHFAFSVWFGVVWVRMFIEADATSDEDTSIDTSMSATSGDDYIEDNMAVHHTQS